MSRSALEVVDIFRDRGPAWRQAHAGHVSLDQLKVMSAIENCRTAAVGGHVAGCEGCAYTTIAYNSCRNRHFPKCQGAAAKDWLADREAELLPVPYYHVVFSLPVAIADQNKTVIYNLLFKASAARIGITSVLHTWGSALTHHPHVHMIVPGGGISPDGARWVSCRPGFFLPVRALAPVPQAAPGEAHRDPQGRPPVLLRQSNATCRCASLRGSPRTAAQRRMGGLCQASVRRSRGRVGLSVALYTPRRHRQQPPDRPRPARCHLQMEGLPRRGPRTTEDHDPGDRRVHPPLPPPRAAKGLQPHRPLRPAGAGACAGNIARARELLAIKKREDAPEAIADADKPRCPCCGGRMILIEVFVRGETPRQSPGAPTRAIRIDTS